MSGVDGVAVGPDDNPPPGRMQGQAPWCATGPGGRPATRLGGAWHWPGLAPQAQGATGPAGAASWPGDFWASLSVGGLPVSDGSESQGHTNSVSPTDATGHATPDRPRGRHPPEP